ncbi:TonB-dependent receptor [Erwinia sp. E602]|uniref:TonB-dependent receptor n=1 Tax=Erwinia sp. E602 TaxID=2675378 RepID=UPI001BA6B8AC|nr:TonB-dependent receptor [Erwinia sp. E602]QUG75828.1 TonB-dependent receptor [Erwinia sp. E602]
MEISKLSILSSLALTGVLCISAPVQAADDTLVVTASGYEQKLTDAPASVSVVSQQKLQETNYQDLGEALSGIEGVNVRGGTGKTGGLDISIRGMASSYTLILVDGVRQSASADLTPNGFGTLNTAVLPPMSAIDHIEVIRGPMSTLYGSDAMGGVINIITKKEGKAWHGALDIGHGFQQRSKWGDSSKYDLYASGPLGGGVDLTLRGSFLHRQGSAITSLSPTGDSRVPFPTASDNYDLGSKISWATSDKNTLWIDGEASRQWYNNSDGQLGPVGVAGGGYRDSLRFEKNKVMAGHNTDMSFGRWSSTLTFDSTENRGRVLTAKTLSPANAGRIGDDRQLKNTNAIFDTSLVAPIGDDHLLTVGGQYWQAKLKDGIVLANSGDTFEQKTWSLYSEDDWQIIDPLSLTWGARYEKHDSFGGHVSPRAYLVWNALDNWTVKGGVSTGYKAPSLAQLHNGVSGVGGNGTTSTLGNPNLKPETSTNIETGVYYDNGDGTNFNVTGFINHFRNAIQSVDLTSTTSSYVNVGKARTQGVEIAGGVPLGLPELTLNANYTYTDTAQIGGKNPGAPLTSTPHQAANARLNWRATPALNTWLAVEYHGRTPRFTNNYANLTPVQKTLYNDKGGDLKAWTVVNLGATYQLTKALKVNGSVNNLLDKDFSEVNTYKVGKSTLYGGDYFSTSASTSGYVMPGRNYWVSLNYSF